MEKITGLFKSISKKKEIYFKGKGLDGTWYFVFKNNKKGENLPEYNLYMIKNKVSQTKPEINVEEIKKQITEDNEFIDDELLF